MINSRGLTMNNYEDHSDAQVPHNMQMVMAQQNQLSAEQFGGNNEQKQAHH